MLLHTHKGSRERGKSERTSVSRSISDLPLVAYKCNRVFLKFYCNITIRVIVMETNIYKGKSKNAAIQGHLFHHPKKFLNYIRECPCSLEMNTEVFRDKGTQ